jgi:hypothetical protein
MVKIRTHRATVALRAGVERRLRAGEIIRGGVPT